MRQVNKYPNLTVYASERDYLTNDNIAAWPKFVETLDEGKIVAAKRAF